jgi:hypothetical protein
MLAHTKRIIKNWIKKEDHLICNPILEGKEPVTGHFVRVFLVKKYPPVILAGYLNQLDELAKKEGVILRKTVRYAPSTVKFNWAMKQKIRRLQKNTEAETLTDPARKEEKEALDTILALRDSQLTGNQKLIDFWTFLTVTAPKAHQLEAVTRSFQTWFDHMNGELDTLHREQLEALRETTLLADPYTNQAEFFNKHHYGRVITDEAAARTYPFTQGSFSDTQGVYFGRRTEDGGFCWIHLCDPQDPRAQNITVVGKTGEGKSFFMKALVAGLLEEGVYVFVFDLDGEWRDLCEEVGGVYIDHTADNGRYFEPLTIMPPIPELDEDCITFNQQRYRMAIENGIRTISLLADGMTKGEIYEAGEAILNTFKEAGIQEKDPTTWNAPYAGERPTIHRLFFHLTESESTAAKSLVEKIKIYFKGIYSHIFSVEETGTFHKAPLVVYKVGQALGDNKDERAKQAQLKMSMAFDVVNANIQYLKFEGIYFSAVLVDEGQRQLRNEELRRAVFDWYTSIRKWNGMMILGSNTPAIMLENAEGQGMWENTSIRVYFYLEQSAIRLLRSHTDIPIQITDKISSNEGSNCFILEYHKKFDELIMDVPGDEAKLYKTRGLRAS